MERLPIAVLLYSGCTVNEVTELATRASNAGHDVIYVSVAGHAVIDQSGLCMQPTTSVNEVDVSALAALVLPGGDPGSVIGDAAVQALVRSASETGALVAAICAGVLIAADAGVTRGRRITHNYRQPWAPAEVEQHVAPLLADATIEADVTQGVVIDDHLITALPNATIEFALTVCERLGIVDAQRAALLTLHLRGEHVPELFSTASVPRT